jgi:hypothetical protein
MALVFRLLAENQGKLDSVRKAIARGDRAGGEAAIDSMEDNLRMIGRVLGETGPQTWEWEIRNLRDELARIPE